ncbi:hypothetical protein RR46_03807 [Papilio xuthus]|uniref:FLYWCH-type domain-containing protein n=1 Tax=Papilio xuthus TaxID=66420 RepID=A0A194Q1I6_PAPXU|nr:hypothetical protein RR46_03807 [Papilio xuthus]
MTNGKIRIYYNNYTFFKFYTSKKGILRWVCTSYPKCKSFLAVNDLDEIQDMTQLLALRNGKQVLTYKGHFYVQVPYSHGTRWRCVQTSDCFNTLLVHSDTLMARDGLRWRCTNTSDCKAFVILSADGSSITAYGIHSHNPPSYHILPNGIIIQEITMASGKTYKYINGYTYGGPVRVKGGELKMIEMDNGRVYYLYDGYTYTYGYKSRKGVNWRCTKKRLCNAFIVVNEDGELILVKVSFAMSQRGGRLLIYNGYSYSLLKAKLDTLKWRCTMADPITTGRCAAKITTNLDYQIINEMYFLATKKKYPLLLFDKYTFKRQSILTSGGVIWYCSNRHYGCKAQHISFRLGLESILCYG